MRFRQQLAYIIRKNPLLMRMAYVVYRFIQPKYSVGVVGVVVNDDCEVLLVEHVFHPKLPWGLPGGWIGFNEDPKDTIQREIQEELGLRVEVETLLLAYRTEYHHLDFAYLCKPTGEINSLSYELLGYSWFKYEALPRIHSFHYRAIKSAFTILEAEE